MRTESLSIVPYEVTDMPVLKEWFQSKDYIEYFRDFQELTEEQLKSFAYLRDGMTFMIRKNVDPVGVAILYDWKSIPRTIKFGIMLDKRYQKYGFAFEATLEIAKYAFRQLHVNKFIIEVMENNERIEKLVTLGGFKKEAVFEAEACIEDKYFNMVKYVVFKDKFDEIMKGLEA